MNSLLHRWLAVSGLSFLAILSVCVLSLRLEADVPIKRLEYA
jgi:hypothetical protein